MKKMSMLILVAASATLVFGQSKNNATQQRTNNSTVVKENIQTGKADIFDQLKLKKKKKVKFEAITEKYKREMSEVMRKNKGNRSAMQSVMEEIRERKNTDVKKVLSKKQFVTYLAMQKERIAKMKALEFANKNKPGKIRSRKGHQGKMGDMNGRKAEMFKDLNLSESQISQMDVIRNKYKAQMQSINQGKGDPVMLKKRYEIIKGQKTAEIKRVLTPVQFVKYQDKMSERGGMDKPNLPNVSTRPNKTKVNKPNVSTRPNTTKENMGKPTNGRPVASNAITADFIKKLNLTAAQKPKFNSVVSAFQTKMRNAMKTNSGNPSAGKMQVARILAQRNKAIQGILDAKQFALFIKSMKANKAER